MTFPRSLRHFSGFAACMLAVAVLWGALFAMATASESRIAVIVSPRISATLTREQIADIFLGRSAPANQWQPIDSSDEVLRNQFYESLAGISANRARAQWARQVFAAHREPPREMPAEMAVTTIGKEEFGIAYVFKEQVPREARILLVLP